MEQPETGADSPTIRTRGEQSFNFITRAKSPLSHSYTESNATAERTPLSPSDGTEDLATIGLAAMSSSPGWETPTMATSFGSDPFGTPQNHRLTDMSLDADVDLVITPPSPVVPHRVS